MAKHKVSREIMDALNVSEGVSHILFQKKIMVDYPILNQWSGGSLTLSGDNERYLDVYRHVVMGKRGLFEVDVVQYAFVQDNRMFKFARDGNISHQYGIEVRDMNMTKTEARVLYDLSKSDHKKVVDSNGQTIYEVIGHSELPF